MAGWIGVGAPESGQSMDIDLGEKVKPSFPEDLFNWFERNGFTGYLKVSGKRPANGGRRKQTYKFSSISEHVKNGFNIGVLIPHGVVILDIDTRKDGFANFDRLLAEAYRGEHAIPTLDDLIKSTFAVRSGSGGLHLYYSHDPAKRARGSLKGYTGVDLKTSSGGYVVAPGGVHPDTGLAYAIENHPEALAELPEALAPYVLESIRDPRAPGATSPTTHPLWGLVKPKELEALLAALDPTQYRDYMGEDKAWINLMSAAHHATGGDLEALEVFADWSAGDPEYAGEAHKAVEHHWPTFKAQRAGAHVATVDSILAAVAASSREASRLGEHGKPHAEADAAARDLRHRIEATSLDVIDGGETANLRAYVATLAEGWYQQTPALLHELAD